MMPTLLLLALTAAPPLPRVGVIAVHDGTIPPPAIRQALHLGYALNWRPLAEQRALAGEGCLSMHFEPRPTAERLQAGLGLTRDDLDQDADGHLADEGYQMATFDGRVIDRYAQGLAQAMVGRADLDHVAAVSVPSPISRYGEAHYAVSDQGGYLAYSRPAKAAFRAWLAEQHRTPEALSAAWGEPLASFDAVEPPRGPKPGPDGIDTRRAWSDWLHWYNAWLLEVTDRTFSALRRVTDRPLCQTLGGMKCGYAQGVFSGNVGPTVKVMARSAPAILDDTDAQTLFSLRYTSTACRQYGVALMSEPVGPPHLSEYAQLNTLANSLSAGSSSVILPHLGELCRADHWFTRLWGQLAPVFDAHPTTYRPAPAVMLHSYVTSWYRADRQNMDCVRLYDATNTNWDPKPGGPSWGRALRSPDVVDDQMLADGVLAGRRLLVIANSGVTVTTRAAWQAVAEWVRGGGTLVCFGTGCMAYLVEADRRLTPTPRLDGLVGELTGDRLDQRVGAGRVVWYRQAAHAQASRDFCLAVQPELTALAREAGITPVCRVTPAVANVLDCGPSPAGGRLFVADLLATVGPPVTFARGRLALTFDPALSGPAELLAVTDQFVASKGGEGHYDAGNRLLTVRFRLPGPLTLDLGN